MTPCALPQALPISCKDCPAFQRLHMSFRCCSDSLNRLLNVINTTFKEMTHSRWCCVDRLSLQAFSTTGNFAIPTFREDDLPGLGCHCLDPRPSLDED